nr:DUF2231 domain-containing protein [Allopontixanthobacter sediminis]
MGPVQSILLAFPVALFPAALLSDIAYLNTAEIQWSNFSSWLIAGADVFTGLLLASALLSLFFGKFRGRGRGLVCTVLVAVLFVAGVLNAFQHAKDGWHSVGTFGLVLSIACAVIAILIAIIAHWRTSHREQRS